MRDGAVDPVASNPHSDEARQRRMKLPHPLTLMLERLLDDLPFGGIYLDEETMRR
jgi:hypothetical protein